MRLPIMLAATAALLSLSCGAQAGWWGIRGHSNDTGGIIAWSPEIADHYREIAAAECARWNKLAIVTSVHPVYGDYVDFVCLWPRDYDPRKTGWQWHVRQYWSK